MRDATAGSRIHDRLILEDFGLLSLPKAAAKKHVKPKLEKAAANPSIQHGSPNKRAGATAQRLA